MQGNLLIVDDDEHIRYSLEEYFKRENFSVATAIDGAEALEKIEQSAPDVIILDVVLPGINGLDVCKAVRQRTGQSIGVIMFSTPKKDEMDQEVGLEVGADVYLPKPVKTRLLLAQVRALMRRIKTKGLADPDSGWFVVDEYLRIHFTQGRVQAGSQDVSLTSLEIAFLKYLIDRPNEPCTQADLMDEVWDYDEAFGPSAVTTCVAKVRAKIEPDPKNPRYLMTKHKFGYYFKLPEE